MGEDVTDEEVLAPAVGSPRQVKLGGGSKQVEPDLGAKDAASDIGEQGTVEPTTSLNDIVGD